VGKSSPAPVSAFARLNVFLGVLMVRLGTVRLFGDMCDLESVVETAGKVRNVSDCLHRGISRTKKHVPNTVL